MDFIKAYCAEKGISMSDLSEEELQAIYESDNVQGEDYTHDEDDERWCM